MCIGDNKEVVKINEANTCKVLKSAKEWIQQLINFMEFSWVASQLLSSQIDTISYAEFQAQSWNYDYICLLVMVSWNDGFHSILQKSWMQLPVHTQVKRTTSAAT